MKFGISRLSEAPGHHIACQMLAVEAKKHVDEDCGLDGILQCRRSCTGCNQSEAARLFVSCQSLLMIGFEVCRSSSSSTSVVKQLRLLAQDLRSQNFFVTRSRTVGLYDEAPQQNRTGLACMTPPSRILECILSHGCSFRGRCATCTFVLLRWPPCRRIFLCKR